jgi:hypothetical protein
MNMSQLTIRHRRPVSFLRVLVVIEKPGRRHVYAVRQMLNRSSLREQRQ